ncbi:MAG: AAA family ATPase [Candidatus Riflebacteria bacterium]|nr:AAA family ATPase [Candidatus Riflebacteria bacterium]
MHQKPTTRCSKYLVLKLDFSTVDVSGNIEIIQKSFFDYIKFSVKVFMLKYKSILNLDEQTIKFIQESEFVTSLLGTLLQKVEEAGKKLYLFIDEYDNFAKNS